MTRKFAVKPVTDENSQQSIAQIEPKVVEQLQPTAQIEPKVVEQLQPTTQIEPEAVNQLQPTTQIESKDDEDVTTNVKRLFKFYADSELRDVIKTVAQFHPNYKNATQFIVECMQLGYKNDFQHDYVVENNRTHELPDFVKQMLEAFLGKNSLAELLEIKGKKVTINFNIEDEFLTDLRLALIKSKKYNSEIQNFSTNQIYIGLKELM